MASPLFNAPCIHISTIIDVRCILNDDESGGRVEYLCEDTTGLQTWKPSEQLISSCCEKKIIDYHSVKLIAEHGGHP